MQTLFWRTGILGLMITLMLRCHVLSARQEGDSTVGELFVRQIQHQWQERYQKFHSVALSIETKETYHRGHSFLSAESLQPNEQDHSGTVIEGIATEIGKVCHSNCAMLLDGEKVLVAESGPRYHADLGAFRHYVVRWAFDGTITRKLQIAREAEFPVQGSLQPEKNVMTPDLVNMMPLRAWLGPVFGSEMELRPTDEKIHDDPLPDGLVEVMDQRGNRIWLVPALDYAPIRFISRPHVSRNWVIQASYKKHESGMWVPTRWIEEYENGADKKTIDHELSEFRINPFIPECAFKQDMPVGTLVHDSRSGTREVYVVGLGGKKTIPDAGFIKSLYDQHLLPEAVYDTR